MIWLFILTILLALILIKVGALSVLVAVFSVAFKLAVLVIAGMGLLMLYIEHRRP